MKTKFEDWDEKTFARHQLIEINIVYPSIDVLPRRHMCASIVVIFI